VAKEKAKASEAAVAGARAAKDRHYQNTELDKAVMENGELREEIKALNADLEAYQAAVSELKGQLEDARDEEEELEATLAQANGRIEELIAELGQANAALSSTHGEIDAKNAGQYQGK